MDTQQSDMGGIDALPVITPATYETVRKMMQEEGIEPRSQQQVSEYVQKLVARESFFRVVDRIQSRNKDVDPEEIDAAVDEAVSEVKADRRNQEPGANRP